MEAAQTRIPKLASWAMLAALPYFEGRLLILAPNIRQLKQFFSVLVCCTGSIVYLSGRHVRKIALELKVLCSEALLYAQQLNSYKHNCEYTQVPDIFMSDLATTM